MPSAGIGFRQLGLRLRRREAMLLELPSVGCRIGGSVLCLGPALVATVAGDGFVAPLPFRLPQRVNSTLLLGVGRGWLPPRAGHQHRHHTALFCCFEARYACSAVDFRETAQHGDLATKADR